MAEPAAPKMAEDDLLRMTAEGVRERAERRGLEAAAGD